jgi:hypothetical protein
MIFYYADREFFAHKADASDHLKRDGADPASELHKISINDRYEIVAFLNALSAVNKSECFEVEGHVSVTLSNPAIYSKVNEDVDIHQILREHGFDPDEVERAVPKFLKIK